MNFIFVLLSFYASSDTLSSYLIYEPRTEDDLECVVIDQSLTELERLAVLHVGRAPDFDDHDVRQTDRQGP